MLPPHPHPHPPCAERRQGIASLALNQVAVIQAMAYAMTQAASLSDWTPKAEPG